ncbi:MAG: arsenate reductase [Rhizobacter sp.]|nr:arsenate reductase [Burkholderiales bacterium]
MGVTVYGIANCDSVKKVRLWLDAQRVVYTFHDYKKQGVHEPELRRWVAAKGWQIVLNRKGTTWRALDDAVKAGVVSDASAIAVMLASASTIKRPVVTFGDTIIVGVDFAALAAL